MFVDMPISREQLVATDFMIFTLEEFEMQQLHGIKRNRLRDWVEQQLQSSADSLAPVSRRMKSFA